MGRSRDAETAPDQQLSHEPKAGIAYIVLVSGSLPFVTAQVCRDVVTVDGVRYPQCMVAVNSWKQVAARSRRDPWTVRRSDFNEVTFRRHYQPSGSSNNLLAENRSSTRVHCV